MLLVLALWKHLLIVLSVGGVFFYHALNLGVRVRRVLVGAFPAANRPRPVGTTTQNQVNLTMNMCWSC